MTYRAELGGRALKQMHGLPGPVFDSLIEVMAEVIDYPDDPLRTFTTSDSYVRRVEFGDAGGGPAARTTAHPPPVARHPDREPFTPPEQGFAAHDAVVDIRSRA